MLNLHNSIIMQLIVKYKKGDSVVYLGPNDKIEDLTIQDVRVETNTDYFRDPNWERPTIHYKGYGGANKWWAQKDLYPTVAHLLKDLEDTYKKKN